jgi:hypothetical protein
MSKISYCSLEEAWGDSYKKIDNSKNEYLNKISELEREKIVDNMNNIERKENTNDNVIEYNKYRLNPVNKVEKNDVQQDYTPFNESIEKKFLQDKLNFLENEFNKYKNLTEKYTNNNNYSNKNSENVIESFENENDLNNKNNIYATNDIIDLILLIIVGLIIILVMNSIFNLGKKIGARNN